MITHADWADTLVIRADHGKHDAGDRVTLARAMEYNESLNAIAGDCVSAFRLRAARLRLQARIIKEAT